MFIEDHYVAYCFNEAVWAFGVFIEGQLDKVKRKPKEKDERYSRRRHERLLTMLADDPSKPVFTERFANPPPMSTVRRA